MKTEESDGLDLIATLIILLGLFLYILLFFFALGGARQLANGAFLVKLGSAVWRTVMLTGAILKFIVAYRQRRTRR